MCVVQAAEAVEALIGEIFPEPLVRSLFGDNSSAISIVSGPPTSWRSRHLRLRSQALRERVESGVWTVYHLSGLLMPADILTKAMAASKFVEMLPLLGVTNPSEDVRHRVLALVVCCALLLKGQAPVEGLDWGWLVGVILVVVLAYEGFRSVVFRMSGWLGRVIPEFGARFPGLLEQHSSTLGARLPEGSTEHSSTLGARLPENSPAPSSTFSARLPEGSTASSSTSGARLPGGGQSLSSTNLDAALHSSNEPASSSTSQRASSNHRSIGVNTNPEDYPPMPPILPATPAAAYRHPVDLVSHQTAHGSCWHQNPECFHLRNHSHFPLVPCNDCTVGRNPYHTSLPSNLRRRRGR